MENKDYSKIDWQEVRSHYPACREQAYFISASVGPLHDYVYSAWSRHIENLYLNGDIHWQENLVLREECRNTVARFLNTEPSNIGFSPNTSHNMNLLAMMLKKENEDKKGVFQSLFKTQKKNIITLADEFPSTVLPWYHHGFNVEKVESENGFVNINKIIELTDNQTIAVVISAVQFSTGFRADINTLGKVLAEKNIYFIVNATQAIGAWSVSVNDAKVSALSASCHKWIGAGFSGSILYTSPEFRKLHLPPMIGWLSVENPLLMRNEPQKPNSGCSSIETGILPFSALAAIKAAFEVIIEIGIENIARRIFYLSNILMEKLKELPLKIITTRDNSTDYNDSINSGIISIFFENPEDIAAKLTEKNIIVSARKNGIRIAVHYFNNEEDIEKLIIALKEISEHSK